jgi:hypothetical protein
LLAGRPPIIRLAPPAESRDLGATARNQTRELSLGMLEDVAELIDKRARFQEIPHSSSRGLRPGFCSTRVSNRSIQSTIAQAFAQRSGLGAGSRQRSVAARVGCTKSTLSRRKPWPSGKAACLSCIPRIDRSAEWGRSSSATTVSDVPRTDRSAISAEPLLEPLWVLFLASHASLVGTPTRLRHMRRITGSPVCGTTIPHIWWHGDHASTRYCGFH